MPSPLLRRLTDATGPVVERWRWRGAQPRGPTAPGDPLFESRADSAGLAMSERMVLAGLLLAVIWTRIWTVVPLVGLSSTFRPWFS